MQNSFEQGPIRPPSEASSLLIRVTRNCPWNKCAFCHTYGGEKFSLRSVAEVTADIQAMKNIADNLVEISRQQGQGGIVNRIVLKHMFEKGMLNDEFYQSVASWLYFGGENVFLQDADSLILKTENMLEILEYLLRVFPGIKRITTYCRSHTAARKSSREFQQLREAGLTRIHIGMESGCDEVLQLIRKGVTAQEHIKAGLNIRQAGMELSEYVIPGLGGVEWSDKHASETALVLNEINPDFIRLRTLHVVPGTNLAAIRAAGNFREQSDEAILREIKLFIEKLDLQKTRLVSDHILNLLEEIEGQFPEEKEKMLSVIDKYFAMSAPERLIYRLGRRSGILRKMADLDDRGIYARLKTVADEYRSTEEMERNIAEIMNNYI